MKKNILIALVVVMLVVVGYLVFKNIAPSSIDDKAALNQVLSDQKNSEPKSSPVDDSAKKVAQTQPQAQPQAQPVEPQPVQPANNSNNNKTMGLEIKTTQEGTGVAVKAGDTVEVKYTGKLTDGTVFDSTDKHGGQPFSFTVGAQQVIKGWDQGLLGAKVGEKRTLTIPGDLAYGPQGIPGVIPPNATLVFDIELVSIK